MQAFDSERFEQFLAGWAQVLLTAPTARSVYYVGTMIWFPSDGFDMQVVPNFVVRTDEPQWESFHETGFPIGEADHGIIDRVDQATLQHFYGQWYDTGWTPKPSNDSEFQLVISDHSAYVRVIKVPAGPEWAGPEYLSRIENGVSPKRIHQEWLRKYEPSEQRFGVAHHYRMCDDRFVIT